MKDQTETKQKEQQLYRMLDNNETVMRGDVLGKDGKHIALWNHTIKAYNFECRIFRPVVESTSENQWRDIDDAPRDGTAIIGKERQSGGAVVCFWDRHYLAWRTVPRGLRWMPVRWIPIPPDEESAEDKEWQAYKGWLASVCMDAPKKEDLAWQSWKAAKGL